MNTQVGLGPLFNLLFLKKLKSYIYNVRSHSNTRTGVEQYFQTERYKKENTNTSPHARMWGSAHVLINIQLETRNNVQPFHHQNQSMQLNSDINQDIFNLFFNNTSIINCVQIIVYMNSYTSPIASLLPSLDKRKTNTLSPKLLFIIVSNNMQDINMRKKREIEREREKESCLHVWLVGSQPYLFGTFVSLTPSMTASWGPLRRSRAKMRRHHPGVEEFRNRSETNTPRNLVLIDRGAP